MRQKSVAVLVAVLFGASVSAFAQEPIYGSTPDATAVSGKGENAPSGSQFLKGVAGAVGGGLVGSQVGKGDGKTAATAVGAGAGAIVASGCKPTAASALVGAIGGFLGAKIAGDKNKNVGAGIGAAAGALLGSDCAEDKPAGGGSANNTGGNPYLTDVGGAVGVAAGSSGVGGAPVKLEAKPPVARANTYGRVVSINKIVLTEVSEDEFPRGEFYGFPRITKKSDFQSLDLLGQAYTKAAYKGLAREDYEAFIVNRHMARKTLEFRLHHKLAALSFVESLLNSQSGVGVLAPGATVFLPAYKLDAVDGAPVQKVADNRDFFEYLLSANVADVDWASLPQTADLAGMLSDGVSSIIKGARDTVTQSDAAGMGGLGSIRTQLQVSGQLAQLPVGAVFSATDKNGQRFLVERTVDGFNLGNAGSRPVSIGLSDFGFMPEVPARVDDLRKKAMPYVKKMQKAVLEAMLSVREESKVIQPGSNKAFVTGGSLPTYNHEPTQKAFFGITSYKAGGQSKVDRYIRFDEQGNPTEDIAAGARGLAKFYNKTDPAYNLAVALTVHLGVNAGERPVLFKNGNKWGIDTETNQYHKGVSAATSNLTDFELRCEGYFVPGSGVLENASYHLWQGDGNVMEKRCYDGENKLAMTRTYFYESGKALQTADSLLKDKEIASGLRRADSVQKLGEALISFVPIVGSGDAAASCTTGKTVSGRVMQAFNDGTGVFQALGMSAEKYRPFVGDLLPTEEEMTTAEKVIECANALPVVGAVVKKGADAKKMLTGFRAWASSDAKLSVMESLAKFDAMFFKSNAVVDFGQLAGLSDKTISMLRTTVNTLSNGQNGYSVGQSVIQFE